MEEPGLGKRPVLSSLLPQLPLTSTVPASGRQDSVVGKAHSREFTDGETEPQREKVKPLGEHAFSLPGACLRLRRNPSLNVCPVLQRPGSCQALFSQPTLSLSQSFCLHVLSGSSSPVRENLEGTRFLGSALQLARYFLDTALHYTCFGEALRAGCVWVSYSTQHGNQCKPAV